MIFRKMILAAPLLLVVFWVDNGLSVQAQQAATADQLMVPLFGGPRLIHMALNQRRITAQKGPPDVLGKGKISRPIASVELVIKNAADAAWLAAMLVEEVLVAPLLKSWVVVGIMTIAGNPESVVKKRRVGRVWMARVKVTATAEP